MALALAWHGSGGSLSALVSGETRAAARDFAAGFLPPAHDAELLRGLLRPLLETCAIALLGMALALLLGGPLSLLAASPQVLAACGARAGPGRRTTHALARAALAVMRSVPEVVWALLFVRAIGLGPAAGVLAIGIAYGGVVGKVFADPWRACRAVRRRRSAPPARGPGAPSPSAILPPARPLLVSYTLYRFDCALRASAVLGLVGAGGLGQQVELSLKMLRYDEVATYVLALFALVARVDLASERLRPAGWPSAARSFPPRWARSGATSRPASRSSFTLAGAAWFLDLSPAALLSRRRPRLDAPSPVRCGRRSCRGGCCASSSPRSWRRCRYPCWGPRSPRRGDSSSRGWRRGRSTACLAR